MSIFQVDEFITNKKSGNIGRVIDKPHAPGYVPVIMRDRSLRSQYSWWKESNCELAENTSQGAIGETIESNT